MNRLWLGHEIILSRCEILICSQSFSLQDLGFKEYIEEVYAAYEQHKLDTLVCTDLHLTMNIIPFSNQCCRIYQLLYIYISQDSPDRKSVV